MNYKIMYYIIMYYKISIHNKICLDNGVLDGF